MAESEPMELEESKELDEFGLLRCMTFRELPIPLNSRCLTMTHLRRLASSIGVPADAAGEEVRQMIDGKLIEMGREPRNVQLILGEAPCNEFRLQDMSGTILTVEVEDTVDEQSSEEEGGDKASMLAEMQALREELESVRLQNATLKDQLEVEKQKMRELWRTNRQCLSEYDELMTRQETEITGLKSKLAKALSDRSLSPASSHSEEEGWSGIPVVVRRSR